MLLRYQNSAKVAHDHSIPLIVDNTFGRGGYLIRPISRGAEYHLAQCHQVDRGPWNHDHSLEGYHGLIFSETFGSVAFAVKLRVELLRDIGPALNPFGAFLLIQGLETLSLRCQRHCDNAFTLANWLEKHSKFAWVLYLGHENHPYYERAKKLLRPNACGGVLSFGVKGNHDVASKAVDALRLASNLNLANVGDAKALVIHPATMTHEQLIEEEQLASGVTPDLIRVAVRIEHLNDIVADFEQALNTVPGLDV